MYEPDTTPNGMSEAEYKACVKNLGLLDGEEVRLQYKAWREVVEVSAWDGRYYEAAKSGLLVFTNDNMIFMQRENQSPRKASDYAQAVRIPLENVNGVTTEGTFIHHVIVAVGVSGASQQHKFLIRAITLPGGGLLRGREATSRARDDVQRLLNVIREEKKRLAVEALAKGTVPTMISCKFCGTKNKSDSVRCSSCGASMA